MPTKTIQYYNQNAKAFTESTLSVDFQAIQRAFTAELPKDAAILDFGCGSGRDAKYFLEKGFQVEAIDGSEELCRLASSYAGIPVRHQIFQDLDEHEKYDGTLSAQRGTDRGSLCAGGQPGGGSVQRSCPGSYRRGQNLSCGF
ncbi:MAG: class I SAM-dependent methyltransferase [Firmicutes bacterium]|nr:class I SAM-dependent methyltransferase [Bacillota bacterium]